MNSLHLPGVPIEKISYVPKPFRLFDVEGIDVLAVNPLHTARTITAGYANWFKPSSPWRYCLQRQSDIATIFMNLGAVYGLMRIDVCQRPETLSWAFNSRCLTG